MGDCTVRQMFEHEDEVAFLERLLRLIAGGGTELGTGRIHTLHLDLVLDGG